ncbi:hypothetical protein [Arthrobacter sp. PsM3]|uniref:hypothetical protein n=1 Tax=Arthrobacter sp. PsM3 TaxID=3030531 RepID=UPI00263B6CDE|nr:hypothetical protein [Arthrobacter sp. PsM3]MDN4642863.1 hypothetical protein [Arthrobacter sp. PsM3]
MTSKESKKSSGSGAEAADMSQAKQEDGKGIKSRLTDAQKEMLASKSRGGAASQSVGHSHKPTHVSGKQGPAEKKVRW